MNVAQAPEWLPRILVPFFTLSYPTSPPSNPDSFSNSSYYGTGKLDACLVLSWLAVLALLREIVRLGILEPFARHWLRRAASGREKVHANGHSNGSAAHSSKTQVLRSKPSEKRTNPVKVGARKMTKKEWMRERSVVRFAEQGWPFLYYCIYWTYGLYIHMSLPTSPWRLTNLWIGYPHLPLAAPIKFYYLTQLAFWLHQVLILNAEAWRKDHIQMMTHHLITIALIIASYLGNFSRVGCLIMVLMDWCDVLLPAAKMTRYLSLLKLCDFLFGLFMLSWLITRQILFLLVIISAYTAPALVPFKWDAAAGHYLTPGIYYAFVSFLGALQLLLCIWFVMICRVAARVLSGNNANDVRSDDEIDETEVDEADLKKNS